jgi:hypothetical protein
LPYQALENAFDSYINSIPTSACHERWPTRGGAVCSKNDAGGSWGELSDTEGDCRFRDAGACARARDPGYGFIKRERVK